MIEDDDDEPELRGFEPYELRPLRSQRTQALLRVVVVVGIVVLVLPGLVIISGMTAGAARIACNEYSAAYAPQSASHVVRFELFSPAGIGWNCYALSSSGDETLVLAMGPIPGPVSLPRSPQTS